MLNRGFYGKSFSQAYHKACKREARQQRDKIENEHKKHKKKHAGRLPREYSSSVKERASSTAERERQFIFACYINFLLRGALALVTYT